jgi:FERM central domain
MLRLIYSEAKKNILTGRYPISKEQCLELAGIQAVINEKETPANEPMTITDFKLVLIQVLLVFRLLTLLLKAVNKYAYKIPNH